MSRLRVMPTCRGGFDVVGVLDCGHFLWLAYPARSDLAYWIRDPYCSICQLIRVPIHWWDARDKLGRSMEPSIRQSGKST